MFRSLIHVLPVSMFVIGALAVTPALAQDQMRLTAKLFVSPAGEPFRAKVSEPYPLTNWFSAADTDGDGRLSPEEFTADAVRFFKVVDTNGDGTISAPENTNYEYKILPELLIIDPRVAQPKNFRDSNAASGEDPTRGRYQKAVQGAAQYSLIDEPQPIRAADTDFNYRISEDEWLYTTEQRFKVLDTNDDGYITLDELPKTPLQFALDNPSKDGTPGGKPKEKKSGWFGGGN